MIRKMLTTDIYNISNLELKIFNNTLGVNFLYDELTINPFAHYFIFELDNKIIGYIGFRIYDENAEILNFLIDTNYQNKGYGTKLLLNSLELINNKELKSISLEVRNSNTIAQNFYKKLGFIKSHIRKNYYETEDAIVLIKEV